VIGPCSTLFFLKKKKKKYFMEVLNNFYKAPYDFAHLERPEKRLNRTHNTTTTVQQQSVHILKCPKSLLEMDGH